MKIRDAFKLVREPSCSRYTSKDRPQKWFFEPGDVAWGAHDGHWQVINKESLLCGAPVPAGQRLLRVKDSHRGKVSPYLVLALAERPGQQDQWRSHNAMRRIAGDTILDTELPSMVNAADFHLIEAVVTQVENLQRKQEQVRASMEHLRTACLNRYASGKPLKGAVSKSDAARLAEAL